MKTLMLDLTQTGAPSGLWRSLRLLLLATLFGASGAVAEPLLPQPAWGRFVTTTNSPTSIVAEINVWPASGRLSLPTPFPNLVSAALLGSETNLVLAWIFNEDASQLQLEVPRAVPASRPARILLETAENSGQSPDGRIVFSALDAIVRGTTAKLETNPGNHRIGFWTDPADSVSWEYRPTRWGRYDVELAFSASGGAGTALRVEVAGQTLTVMRPATGSWYRYQTVPVGRVYLAKAEPFALRVGCAELKGGAVMNLKAVTLRPAPEGEPIVPEASGLITLRAQDATVHGVTLRYEPATNKNCLGYWSNPADWADWNFTLPRPGTYDIEVWQGCGAGQGGSDVSVEAGDRRFSFVVEDTGHFQNFKARQIGRVKFTQPGRQSLALRPQRKPAGAVMDVRQVRLLPVTGE